MKPIRMIVIDLDDTLLSDSITVSERTIKAIGQAKQQGVEVAIATGRMFTTARPYGKMLNLGDIPMVLFSGALVQTVESGKILYHNPVSQEETTKLLAIAKDHGWMMQTYIDDVLYVPEHNHWVQGYEDITGITAVVQGEAFYHPQGASSKILAYGEKADLDHFMVLIEEAMPGRFTLFRSKPTFLEIIKKGVDKGMGLDFLCDYFHIPAENVMAIGNSMNDIGMLKKAGLAVAVGNAEQPVKDISDYITATNNDDGVAQSIEKYVL